MAEYHFTKHFLLCNVYPGAALAERPQELPLCHSLKMHKDNDLRHGLPMGYTPSFVIVPQLREFELKSRCFCPMMRPGEELSVDSLAPLTTFRYKMEYPRDIWFFPPEVAALEAVLGKLCGTFPVQRARPDVYSHCADTRLREFIKRGSPLTWDTFPAPLVALLSSMRGLHTLSFKIHPVDNV